MPTGSVQNAIQDWYKMGQYAKARQGLRGKGIKLANSNDPNLGAGLRLAYTMYNQGRSPEAINKALAAMRAGGTYHVDEGRRPGAPGRSHVDESAHAGVVGVLQAEAPGMGSQGNYGAAPGGAPVDPSGTGYDDYRNWAGGVPGLVSTGTLMGRNPFGPGFGFNPQDYARAIVAAKYDPQFAQIKSDEAKTNAELEAAGGRVNTAYNPVEADLRGLKQDTENQGVQAVDRVAMLAKNLGITQGVGANLEAVQRQALTSNQQANDAVEAGSRDRAAVLSDYTSQAQGRLHDLRDARKSLAAGKGGDYRAALIEGMTQRQNLLTGAVANRGALFSQEMSRALGVPTLAQGNIAAQTALDELYRGRSGEGRDQAAFEMQMAQAMQAGEMNRLQMDQMRQELGGTPQVQKAIGGLTTGDKSNLWSYIVQNFQTQNTRYDEEGTPIVTPMSSSGAMGQLYDMAVGMGVKVKNAKQKADLMQWIKNMVGKSTVGNVNWPGYTPIDR